MARPERELAGGMPVAKLRPWRRAKLAASAAALAFAAFGSGGCSMSYQLGSLFGKGDDRSAGAELVETTGSTRPAATKVAAEAGDGILEADLSAARAAAAKMLASGAKDTSAPWQNPDTGSRGMVTPLTTAYTQDGFTCRDFLASIVRETAEIWLQGEACRVHKGKWVVRAMKPWKRA